jgi:hypothetical protein
MARRNQAGQTRRRQALFKFWGALSQIIPVARSHQFFYSLATPLHRAIHDKRNQHVPFCSASFVRNSSAGN